MKRLGIQGAKAIVMAPQDTGAVTSTLDRSVKATCLGSSGGAGMSSCRNTRSVGAGNTPPVVVTRFATGKVQE